MRSNLVLIFRNQLFKGSETFIYDQARTLIDFEPLFIGRDCYGPIPNAANYIKLDTLFQKSIYMLSLKPHEFLKKIYSLEKIPNLIHAHFGVDGVYGLNLAKALNLPLITTFHGFDATLSNLSLIKSKKISWINYFLYRKNLAQDGKLFICVSDFIRQKVLALGFPESRTIRHYIGVDIQKFYPLHDPANSKLILHIARLVEKKGTQYLIDAFAKVALKEKDSHLIIIGDGPLRKQLETQVEFRGLTKRVTFLGALSHQKVVEWLGKCAFLILPSLTANSNDSEGLPIVLMEAAACGLPVIATNHGGIPEAVIDGRTGFLVNEKNVDELSERIDYLLNNDQLRSLMGKNARINISCKFNLQKQTEILESIYKNICE